MTQFLVYPANLPGPISMSQQRAERRALTGLPGPRARRALWRDRLDPSAPITFRFRTLEQAQTFVDWLHTDQIDGGAWFAADWRVPQGGGGIFRFLQLPAFPQWLAPDVWECSGIVEIRGRSLPPEGASPGVLCDLLIHFDQTTPISWRDASVHKHTLTIHEGPGSIDYTPDGKFSGGMAIDQAYPGVTSGANNQQSYMAAEGRYFFATDEFYVSMWINSGPPLDGSDASLEWGLISNASPGNTGGMYLRLSGDGAGHGVLRGGFLAGGFATFGTINGPFGSRNHVCMSRKNLVSPSEDVLSVFWNGVRINGAVVSHGAQGGIQTTRDDLLVGCRIDAGGTNAGYEGMVDEVFINHGPGTGVYGDFTPPTQPYSNANLFPPFT